MSEELINKVLAEVVKKMGGDAPVSSVVPVSTPAAEALSAVTRFVGTNVLGNIIGMVITNVDPKLCTMMKLEKDFRPIEILGVRTGAGPYIFVTDEAAKATNPEILTIELSHDIKSDAGYGSLIIFGAEGVSNARRAVEVALGELDCTFDDVYGNNVGHLRSQYTARASYAPDKAFGTPTGKAFDTTVGAPIGIGVVLANATVEAATVDVIGYTGPTGGTSYSNGVISFLSGSSDAVRQVIIAAREVGILLLDAPSTKPESTTTPYI